MLQPFHRDLDMEDQDTEDEGCRTRLMIFFNSQHPRWPQTYENWPVRSDDRPLFLIVVVEIKALILLRYDNKTRGSTMSKACEQAFGI